MTEKIKDYIGNCLKCIQFNLKSGKTKGMLNNIPKGNAPFETIHIDLYIPLPKTRTGENMFLRLYMVSLNLSNYSHAKFENLYIHPLPQVIDCS